MTAAPKAKLIQRGSQRNVVEFEFNPNRVTIGHASVTTAVNQAMGVPSKDLAENKVVVAGGDVVTDLGDTTITFEKLTLDDADMRAKCRQLIQWTYPIVMPPAGGSGSSNLVIPELVFSWGNFVFGLPFQPVIIYLSSVEVEYFRFTERGAATRAHVSISCKVKIKAPPGQNPTSGGKPGRGGHQVIDGQNIQGIALSRYGDPKRWRDLADANGIDDPLRVRAGDVLYLPNRGELGRAAR